MAVTYEPIASTTLGSAAANVDLTSIPGTYTDLLLVCNTGSTGAGSSFFLRLNSDSASNYSSTLLYGTGSAAGSNRTSSTGEPRVVNRIPQNLTNGIVIVQLMNYANTNVYKTWLASGADHSQFVERSVGLWRSTSAITSIRLFADSGTNLVSGSTFSLYGIKASA